MYATGLQATKDAEYFVPTLYNDVAHYCTIGYGHLIKRLPCDGSEPSEFRNGITEQRGTDLLIKDMETAEVSVMLAVKPDLTDGQYAALCDFAFNVGTKHFKDSTLLQVVNAEQFDRVPEQFRRWTIAGGKPVKGLANRREREISVFFDGLPIPKGAPSLGEDMSPIDIRAGEDADGQ
ncbi:hypothetical protein CR51_35690 [Caballeronia megalochromosomata]|nr:hypothetical protein CR51_35690 [Caballeronia megalochromosomata]